MSISLQVERLEPYKDVHLDEPFRRLLGWRTGLIKEAFIGAIEPNDPELFHVSVMHSSVDRMVGAPMRANLRAAGSGLSLTDALHRAFGEVVERYSCHFYDRTQVVYGTYKDLVGQGLDAWGPDRLQFFAPEQRIGSFPFAPFTEDTLLGWTRVTNLMTGHDAWLPAQLLHFAYQRRRDEPPVVYPTSSGVAAATSLEEAFLKGFFEQVERDSVMLTWFLRLSPPAFDFSGLPAVASLVHGRGYFRPGREFQLRYMTTDLPFPAFLGVAKLIVGGKRRAFVGGAAGIKVETAAFKAFLELGQGVPFIKTVIANNPWPTSDRPMDNFDDNLRYYADPEHMQHLNFLTANERMVRSSDIEPGLATGNHRSDLLAVLRVCKERGLTPLAYDHTPADMADLGFRVGRIFVPELVQLGVPAFPLLGTRRLYEMPVRLGRVSKPITYTDLNPLPHPYP